MSKFKVGDKVLFGNQVVEITQIFDSGKCMVSNGWLQNSAWIDDLESYKTAHEKLIEKGFEEFPRYNERYYILDNDEQYIEIYIDIKGVNYYVPNNEYVDLELSCILTQYLEELEKDEE